MVRTSLALQEVKLNCTVGVSDPNAYLLHHIDAARHVDSKNLFVHFVQSYNSPFHDFKKSAEQN